MIEEGSPNLSGGQRQRLAIARALVHDPRILILDEATSALDPESEALVNANLAHMARGRTMVIVSHRLSSLTDCDAILVLDQGRVLDLGPHRDLLVRCPTYQQLWHQQNRHLIHSRSKSLKVKEIPVMSVTTENTRALLEFQSPTAAVIADRIPLSGRLTIWVIAAAILSSLGVMGFYSVDRVVAVPGKVVAKIPNIVVQPLETSIVRQINVREGQLVHAGDRLAMLDPTFAAADAGSLDEQVSSLQAEVDRLQAEADGRTYLGNGSAASQLQAMIFAQKHAERAAKLESYRQRIDSAGPRSHRR